MNAKKETFIPDRKPLGRYTLEQLKTIYGSIKSKILINLDSGTSMKSKFFEFPRKSP